MKSLKEIADNKAYSERKQKYDNYLDKHISGVQKCFEEKIVPFYELSDTDLTDIREQLSHHDESKYGEDEYEPYLNKFYKYPNTSMQDVQDTNNKFAYAWLHHIHNNPHHPQYWYLRNDTDHEDDRMLDMPLNYIIEMLCDWGSFAYMDSKLKSNITPNSNAHHWYELHGGEIGFSDNTIKIIEEILDKCPNL